ncbi:hypothetical protein MRB53_005090 [Persea americana]|uniref:Uncharacterized protein n=2 Tax=Persea americana TaxID=3435 RepID=A0ACC2MCJ1_PERAE|nr:hypothetical protein MRB53_005087 [Persea americana]KAJ8643342.1 hypothetical protein MRB53_005090 [Persea americana]
MLEQTPLLFCVSCLNMYVVRQQLDFTQHKTMSTRPVKLHFTNGSTMAAGYAIVTISLSVLKAGISKWVFSVQSPTSFFQD